MLPFSLPLCVYETSSSTVIEGHISAIHKDVIGLELKNTLLNGSYRRSSYYHFALQEKGGWSPIRRRRSRGWLDGSRDMLNRSFPSGLGRAGSRIYVEPKSVSVNTSCRTEGEWTEYTPCIIARRGRRMISSAIKRSASVTRHTLHPTP